MLVVCENDLFKLGQHLQFQNTEKISIFFSLINNWQFGLFVTFELSNSPKDRNHCYEYLFLILFVYSIPNLNFFFLASLLRFQ